jgi:hypothetical protein
MNLLQGYLIVIQLFACANSESAFAQALLATRLINHLKNKTNAISDKKIVGFDALVNRRNVKSRFLFQSVLQIQQKNQWMSDFEPTQY